MNHRRIALFSAVLTMLSLIALPGTAALATTGRTVGQLNHDFGGTQFAGFDYATPSVSLSGDSCADRSYTWTVSTVSGNSTYVGATTTGDTCTTGSNMIVVAKYTSGTLDTTFDSDGYRFIKLSMAGAAFRGLGDMTMTPDGELLIMGQLEDQAYQPPGADFANWAAQTFFLKITANGSDSIQGTWGNALGNTYATGTNLHLSVLPAPWQLNKNYSAGTSYARSAVNVIDEGGERWIVMGGEYINGVWQTWYATLSATGALETSVDGHSDFGGISFVSDQYTGSTPTGLNCAAGSVPGTLAYDQYTSKIYATVMCAASEDSAQTYLMSFDSATQRLDTTFDSDGFKPLSGTGSIWTTVMNPVLSAMESYDTGTAMMLVFAGKSTATTAWAGVYNATTRVRVNENTMPVTTGSDKFAVYGLGLSSGGQAYLFGSFTKFGSKLDALTMHFDASSGTFDSSWAGSGVGIYGGCGDEYFITGEISSGSGLMGFGYGRADTGTPLVTGDVALAARIFSASGNQSATPGTAPVWTDSTFGNGTPNVAYSDSVAATGATAYVVTNGTLPTGFSFDGSTGTLSGTPTATAAARDLTVCASNKWGKATLTDSVSITTGPVGPSFANASYSTTTVVGSDVAWSSVTATPGDDTAVTYSYSGTLPDGVTYDTASHAFIGIARSTGSFTGTLTATTSIGTATTSITLTIGAGSDNVAPGRPAWYTDTAVVGLTKSSPINYRIHVTGNFVPTCAVTSGDLPVGLELDPATCVISGTPTFGGDYAFTVTATNTSGTKTFDFAGTTSGSNPTNLALILNLEVGDVATGADVELQGEGLLASSDWYADIHSTPVTIASGVASIGGNFYFLAQLPTNIEPGEHVVTLYGTDPSGNPLQTSTFITVAADGSISYIDDVPPGTTPDAEPTLPQTGLNATTMYAQAMAALGLISAGLFLLAARRRRL